MELWVDSHFPLHHVTNEEKCELAYLKPIVFPAFMLCSVVLFYFRCIVGLTIVKLPRLKAGSFTHPLLLSKNGTGLHVVCITGTTSLQVAAHTFKEGDS